MKLQGAEVVLIRMQFHQAQGSKIRPALVLFDAGDEDFLAAPITSQPRASEFDLVVADWQAAGLNVPSTARVHKLTVGQSGDRSPPRCLLKRRSRSAVATPLSHFLPSVTRFVDLAALQDGSGHPNASNYFFAAPAAQFVTTVSSGAEVAPVALIRNRLPSAVTSY